MGWKEDLRRNLGTGGTATTSAQPLPEWKRKLKENLRPIIESKKAEKLSQPQPVKQVDAITNAQNLYSGKGFVAYNKTIGQPDPTTLPKSQYNPFGSLESRININPTVANSTKAIPGAMETKADNLTRTVLQTPKELAKQAGSNVAGLLDLVTRSGLQTVSAVGSFVSPAVVSVIKAAEEELKAAEKDFKAAEKEPMPDSKGQLADISYDQIWKDAMEAGEKRMLDIGRPDEYFRSKITGTPYQENLLFMDEIKALAKSSNEKMASGDTDGSFKDAGKIGGYAFMRDMANPFFLFSVRGVSQGSFHMTPAEETLYKIQLNPSKEGFLGKKIKVKPKQAVCKIDVKPKYDRLIIVDGRGKVKVQKSPNVKMYINQKSNGVVDIKVTNSGGEIFNKDIIKASFDKAGVSGLPAVQQTFSAKPVIPSISPATPAATTRGVGSLITPTTPTGLQFSGQELLQPNQEMAAPTGPVLDFGSPSAVSQPAVEPQAATGETINQGSSSQPITQLDKSDNEVYNEKTSLTEEVKKHNSADEFIQSQDVDNNLVNVYNKIYGKEENSNQFVIPEGLYRGQGLSGNERTGTVKGLSKDIKGSISEISKYINDNPEGFTLNLKGEPVSSGFAVSPYKGREIILDRVDDKSLESFLLNNFDLLREEGNNFGGWLNTENGKFYLDISKVVDNIDDAIGYAVYNDQISIFDLGNQSEIVTKDFLKSRLKDVWNRENNEAVAKRAEEESQLFTGKQPNKVLENDPKNFKTAEDYVKAQKESAGAISETTRAKLINDGEAALVNGTNERLYFEKQMRKAGMTEEQISSVLDSTPTNKIGKYNAEDVVYGLTEHNLKTKSQLISEWNKANSEPSTQKESVKKSIEEGPKTVKTSKKPTPSVQADKGVYAENVVGKGKTEFKTIETPEQYRLAKSLGKDMKFIMKSSSRFNGFFRPEPGGDSVVIGMNRNFYKKGKEETSQQYQTRISKTMAHEIGHFIDFLPEGNMKRGNLIGRLQSLSEFKKNFMTEPEVLDERKKLMRQINKINKDENLTEETKMKMVEPLMKELAGINESIEFNNPIYKEELVNLSKTWKPWTEGVDERYDSYRKSSAELYADFVSVLFNDPALAQEKAPRFYDGFFSALNNKPEVEQSLLGIQGELMGDRTSLMTKRYNMLKDSGKNAQGRFAATVAERQALNKKPWLQALIRDNWYQHYWVKKYGKKVENLMEVLDRGFNNELYTWTEKNVKPIMDKLTAAGLDANDMDAVLSLERIAKDASRANVANVKGLDVKTSEDVLAELENIVGADKAKVLLDTASDLRSALKEIQKGFPDLFTQEQIDLIDSNDFYVPFNVLFNESNNIGYYIRESKGNIDKDFSPFVNTLLRTKSVIHFGEKNLIKKGVIDSIIDENSGDIKKAVVTHNKMANGQIVRNVKDAPAGWGLVEIKREGKLESYYLPEDIAHSLNQDDLGKLSAIIKPLNVVQKPFKELYTGIINPGFQITNFVFRDWGQAEMMFGPEWKRAQTDKSNAGLNVIANNSYRFLFQKIVQAKFYWKSFKNVLEKNIFRRYTPVVKKALKDHVIEVDINGMYKIDTNDLTEQDQAGIKYILQTGGLIEKGSLFNRISNNIKGFTQSLEETPKLAAYMYMQELGVVNEDNLSVIRNYVGSPNFWKQGRDNKNISSVFMFYNPMIRGMENLGKKAFIKDAAGKGSRTAFWFRVMRAAVIPALLQVAAEEGLFGDDLKKKYGMLPEYLKGNYLNIPLEIATNGRLRSISLPMDEDARLIHAFTRNIARAALNSNDRKIRNSALADVLAYTGGQIPGTAPAITITSQWSIMLAGGNPYDTFRRRNIFLDNEENLSLSEKSKIMAKWTLNQSGILKLELNDRVNTQTTFEQVLTFAPAVGRFVRSTNRGEYEADQMVVEEERKKAALKLMDKKKVVNDIVEKLHKNPDYNAARDILDLAKERLGPEASDSAKLVKEFKLLNSAAQEEYVTNFGNVHYRSIINQSNDVKEKVMIDIWNRKAMNKKEFIDFVLTATNLSIISKEVRNNILLSTGVLNK